MATDRIDLARGAYRDAIAAARARSTPMAWARLVRAGEELREALREAGGRRAAAAAGPSRAVQAAQHRVLVVEDDAATRDALRDILAEHRFDVRAASSGAEALEILRGDGWTPSAIVLDAVLPDASAAEVHARLRADPRLAGIPVVIMSARRDARIPSLCFFEKPFDPTELIEVVTQLSSRR